MRLKVLFHLFGGGFMYDATLCLACVDSFAVPVPVQRTLGHDGGVDVGKNLPLVLRIIQLLFHLKGLAAGEEVYRIVAVFLFIQNV